ncbi:hypothetical protein RCF34_21570 [Pseudomonas sp. 102515]|jgi:hypothetical protein|uniref:hypothetical protein n=1 Tax=Pseudomonas sp. 102515 TaxID=3071568 RepID=UPI0028020F69|nr:hypothetical protein [Pseudomonas sp. 102515]MDQ7915704.1 hypothetical protein [Pseudomonas sp. 102515]
MRKTPLILALSAALALVAGPSLAANNNDAGVTGNGIGAPGSSNTSNKDSADDTSTATPSTQKKADRTPATKAQGSQQKRVLND